MTTSRNFNKRRMTSTVLTAMLLTVAATVTFQLASASSINRLELQSRQEHDIFENVNDIVKRAYDSPSESAQSSFLAHALSLAGTYSPTVSTIAGKSASTSSSKKTTTTTSSSSTKKATTTTSSSARQDAASTSSSTKKTSTTSSSSSKATSSSKESSAAFPNVKTLASSTSTSKSTSAGKTTTASISSSSKAATPTAATLTKATSAQAQAVKTTTSSRAAGPYGCGKATPSGRALLCYATGAVTSPSKRSLETPSPLEARELDEEDYVRRPSLNSSSIIAAIDNLDSSDLGWLDTIVGVVLYKTGDFVSSIFWIVATVMLLPLFLIRLARRSSLIAHVLISVFLWICLILTAFGIRAWMANTSPSTTYMIAENVILQILPNLLLEPLLTLLAMYSVQGGVSSGVPSVCLLLRLVNFIAMVLFAVSAAFTSIYINKWNQALLIPTALGSLDAFPAYLPLVITRLGPVIGSFMMLGAIAGGLLL